MAHSVGPAVNSDDIIEQQVQEIERQLQELNVRVGYIVIGTPDEPIRQKDIAWTCTKCGYTLGLYDREERKLRLRMRGQIMYVETSRCDAVSGICPKCSEPNPFDCPA